MKKYLVCMLVLLLCSGFIFAREETPQERKNAIVFKPGSLMLGALIGVVDIFVEYQHAFGQYFVLTVAPEIAFSFLGTAVGVELGAVIHPTGHGLKGFYFGFYPGIYVGDWAWTTSWSLELGYEWVFNSGFVLVLGGGAGYIWISGPTPRLNISLGFAF